MSGLIAMTQSFSVPTATGVTLDIVRELGLRQEKLIFDQRTKALTKPGDYNIERNKQFAKMAAAVKNTYDSTLLELQNSGLSTIKSQQMAINAAAMTKEIQREILETQFPSGSDKVALQASAKDSFPGMLETPDTKPAPARKARVRKAPAKKN